MKAVYRVSNTEFKTVGEYTVKKTRVWTVIAETAEEAKEQVSNKYSVPKNKLKARKHG